MADQAPSAPARRRKIAVNQKALKNLKMVVVAYSHVEREWFPNDEAYEAEREVEERSAEVAKELETLGVPVKTLPADRYFLTNILVDRPDLVLNLVDTVNGRDALQTAVPAALELSGIPYTGAGMRGLVVGNDRNLFKELLDASDIPTPEFQLISRRGVRISEKLGLPLIVKLNESGGSVGIDNQAVKETIEDAEERANQLIGEYHLPVIVEEFINGLEVTVVVYDDGQRKHVFQAQKKFHIKPDGKYEYTSLESYAEKAAYTYNKVEDKALENRIERLASKAFTVLHNRDYAKFDVRVGAEDGKPYFTDCNPNTAFGPSLGLPFTEVLNLHGVKFSTVLASLISKYARKID